MKKVRLLLIINIVQVVLLITSICASVIILPKIMHFGENKVPLTVVLGTEDDKLNGYAQVTAYGAVADDGKDDTAAFKKALETNASIYVPTGTYDLKDTIVIESKNLKGSGNTVIRSSAEKAVAILSGSVVIEDVDFCFADGDLTGNEKSGEKVALLDNGLTQGSMIRGVGFNNVGTGFYSNLEKGALCTTIEAVTFNNFSYKAIEITNGMSAVIRSATVGKAFNSVTTPVSLGGVVTVEAMGFTATECDYALEFNNATSVFVKNLSFKDVKATKKALVNCNSARFTVQVATLLNTGCDNLFAVNDTDGTKVATAGTVNMVYSNTSNDFSISQSEKIISEFKLK